MLCVGCDAEPDVPFTTMTVPDQCGGACGSKQICLLNSIHIIPNCYGFAPMACDPDAGGCWCVKGLGCAAPPDGCSATDCACIVKKTCTVTNNNGTPCGGSCEVVGDYAQVSCNDCS